MSAHFKWYPSSDDVIVPFNARYEFPSQANKAVKMTPRIPPKNGALFNPGNVIRVEFPAQGYVNPLNTTLEFDVTLVVPNNPLATGIPTGAATGAAAGYEYVLRFQNNIQSIFNRVRLLYGATPLEDIINYNVIVRNLTEWTTGGPHFTIDQSSITDGVGNVVIDTDAAGILNLAVARSKYIQGYSAGTVTTDTPMSSSMGSGVTGAIGTPNAPSGFVLPTTAVNSIPVTCVTRRYQIQFALGLFTQDKLVSHLFFEL